jgi:hypothetical protein
MHLDEVCGMIISAYYKESGNSSCMSRQKLPCTRCGAHLSTTWRPGPCGTSSLCNACGVQYMVRGDRPRMIDMVMDDSRVIWMERNPESYQWFESSQADLRDPRILKWFKHEEERVQFADSKKRRFADL